MPNPFFSGRIPPDLHKRVEQYKAETGESKTDILINALAAYLNYPVSKLAHTIVSSETEERFRSLESRITTLELEVLLHKDSDKKSVIAVDNNKQESLVSDNFDNIFDNQSDNKIAFELKEVEPEPIKNAIDNNNINNKNLQEAEEPLNILDMGSKQPHPIFELITSAELRHLTGITQGQVDNYKRKVNQKYKKLGQTLEERKMLEAPEKINSRKPVTLKNYPYDLFYAGQNEKSKDLWTALPYDNKRYQELSAANPELFPS